VPQLPESQAHDCRQPPHIAGSEQVGPQSQHASPQPHDATGDGNRCLQPVSTTIANNAANREGGVMRAAMR
jgi:hypothetical protein